jgi:hypothetical protein
MIMAAVLAAAGLPGRPWCRQARSLIPGLYPRGADGRERLRVSAVTWLQYALAMMVIAYGLQAGAAGFAVMAIVAVPLAALAVLALPRKWPIWLFAALVAGSAAAAVVAYTCIDIGPVAGLPNMYEPSWDRRASSSPRRRRGWGRPGIAVRAATPAPPPRRRPAGCGRGRGP